MLQSTFTVDIVAMVFGMPRVLFPVLADEQFHRGTEVVGWLFAAPALGALVGALTLGLGRSGPPARASRSSSRSRSGARRSPRSGWWGPTSGSRSRSWRSRAAPMSSPRCSATRCNSSTVPDDLRGRLASFNIFVVAGGPRLGDLEGGLVAAAFTPTISVVSGGLLCLAGVAVIAIDGAALRALARRRSALIDRTVQPRLTATDGGVLGDTPSPKARHQAGGTSSRSCAPRRASSSALDPLPDGVRLRTQARGAQDVVLFFATRRAELERRFDALARTIAPAGGLWIAWPKRTACVATDLREGIVRELGLAHGLVDNKVCAVDDTWSGLRFVYRLSDRPSRNGKSH